MFENEFGEIGVDEKVLSENVDDEVINNHLRFSFGWNIEIGDGKKSAEIVKNTIKEII